MNVSYVFLRDLVQILLGVNTAEVKGYRIRDVSIQDVEKVMMGWYETKNTYQFPGGNQSFESCSNESSVKDYGLFTQVYYFSRVYRFYHDMIVKIVFSKI